ncbi:unnamed protein product [Fraxinus pennsylvanica]|uniref:Uncharacterized protein n=1 Tax=Fraxinus pennsylvanica TaxID=56036 RepID=A0AAD2ECS9_9LAMI|nr:unnamed protein product [Fraxinus pennsylvanica]
MKSLIKYMPVNKKNLGGKTALDILEPENFEARKVLIRAGAKEGSSVLDDATNCEYYLKSNMTMEDFFIKFGAYMEFGLSADMRNAFLVVLVLIATAMFQELNAPSTSTNSTSTNLDKKLQWLEELDLIFNSIAFGLAMGTCAILILDLLQKLYLVALALYFVSYAALQYGIYPAKVLASRFRGQGRYGLLKQQYEEVTPQMSSRWGHPSTLDCCVFLCTRQQYLDLEQCSSATRK